MSDLDTFARRYQAALDSQRDSKGIVTRARVGFSERLEGGDAPAPSSLRRLLPVASLLAAAALVAFVVWPEPPLGVSLRSHPGTAADFVATGGTEDVLDFTDGSEVRVRAGSELRVLDVLANGSHVALERGAAHVAVVHRAKTRWLFSAGPYRVHVVGTQFELSWNPETGGLMVAMDDGIVEVDGPGLARQRVTSRQRLEANAQPASASLFLAPTEAPKAQAPSPVAEPEPSVSAARRPRVEKAPAVVVERPRSSGPSWRQLADKGDDLGAMNAAEQAGFTWLSNSMPRGDVLALGNVALKAGQPAQATEAWLAVRHRFAGTTAATDAAIRLGHLEADLEHDHDASVRWFSVAVREAPNATTAPQALGDWLEVLVHAGRNEQAKKVATEYLRRFKNGPSAELAKTVLGGAR
jgi:ferric-dicitrate binding protein FerR (iron transport regulator)